MSSDDVERVARAIYESDKGSGRLPWARLTELSRDIRRREARAALSALPERELRYMDEGEQAIMSAALRKSAKVVSRNEPERELLREALDALTRIHSELDDYVTDNDGEVGASIAIAFEVARAAADKIRAALTQEKQT